MKATKTSRPHDEVVIDMLKNDPDFANEYRAVALLRKQIDPVVSKPFYRLLWMLFKQMQTLHSSVGSVNYCIFVL
jgi:hypothetical protein